MTRGHHIFGAGAVVVVSLLLSCTKEEEVHAFSSSWLPHRYDRATDDGNGVSPRMLSSVPSPDESAFQWVTNANSGNGSTISVSPKEIHLDWKVFYENAVQQMYTLQQQVNDQIQVLLDEMAELQQRVKSMALVIQSQNVQIQLAANETRSWQELYIAMRQLHLVEMERMQNQYDAYQQSQRHEQVRKQIQYQRMEQELQGQRTNHQTDLERLRMQYENEALGLVRQHQRHVQELQANATLEKQIWQEQSQNELLHQLQEQEYRYNTTILEPLRQQFQELQSELATTQEALRESQQQIAALQQKPHRWWRSLRKWFFRGRSKKGDEKENWEKGNFDNDDDPQPQTTQSVTVVEPRAAT